MIYLNETHFLEQFHVVHDIIKEELSPDKSKEWLKLTVDKRWVKVFSRMRTAIDGQYKDILKIVEYMFAIPAHNANNERIFSLMNFQWTHERDLLKIEPVEALLACAFNFNMSCTTNVLLKQGRSEKKYNKEGIANKPKSSSDSADDVIEID